MHCETASIRTVSAATTELGASIAGDLRASRRPPSAFTPMSPSATVMPLVLIEVSAKTT
jgi:hypothetical protein